MSGDGGGGGDRVDTGQTLAAGCRAEDAILAAHANPMRQSERLPRALRAPP